tara:strand:+ start:792 stop:1256 length:465 start_codon:yes stop_codon:yes gene_type:complete
MNYKKKSLILNILLIVSIHILLLINNRQKTSFRFFTLNVREVSIGKLICVSFISGLLMNSIIKITSQKETRTLIEDENDYSYSPTDKEDYSINSEDKNESNEKPPERDLRDVQPTISVNYRVIKDNRDNESNQRNQSSQNSQYQDDWSDNYLEW